MDISTILRIWLKYPYNIHQEINKYLGNNVIKSTQPPHKKPYLYKEVVFTSGRILGRVCITKKITKKSLKKEIHALLVKYNPSISYHEFTHKIFVSWTQSIDEVLDQDLYEIIVDSQDELCICPGIFDVSNMKCIHTFEEDNVYTKLNWDPSGKYLASGGVNFFGINRLKIWNMKTGQCLYIITGHDGGVESVSWDPSGTYLASGSVDKTIKIWGVSD